MVRAIVLALVLVSLPGCVADTPRIKIDTSVKPDFRCVDSDAPCRAGYANWNQRFVLSLGQVVQADVPGTQTEDSRVLSQIAASSQSVSFRAVGVGETLLALNQKGHVFRLRVVVIPEGLSYDFLLTEDNSTEHLKVPIGKVVLLVLVQANTDFGPWRRVVIDPAALLVSTSGPTVTSNGVMIATYQGAAQGAATITGFTDPAPKGVAVINFYADVTAQS